MVSMMPKLCGVTRTHRRLHLLEVPEPDSVAAYARLLPFLKQMVKDWYSNLPPLEQHLWRVSFDTGEDAIRITYTGTGATAGAAKIVTGTGTGTATGALSSERLLGLHHHGKLDSPIDSTLHLMDVDYIFEVPDSTVCNNTQDFPLYVPQRDTVDCKQAYSNTTCTTHSNHSYSCGQDINTALSSSWTTMTTSMVPESGSSYLCSECSASEATSSCIWRRPLVLPKRFCVGEFRLEWEDFHHGHPPPGGQGVITPEFPGTDPRKFIANQLINVLLNDPVLKFVLMENDLTDLYEDIRNYSEVGDYDMLDDQYSDQFELLDNEIEDVKLWQILHGSSETGFNGLHPGTLADGGDVVAESQEWLNFVLKNDSEHTTDGEN